MRKRQPTSKKQDTAAVSSGLAKHIGRVLEDAALKYPGGLKKLEIVKGDPALVKDFYRFLDRQAAKRATMLARVRKLKRKPVWKTVEVRKFDSPESLRKLMEGKVYMNGGYCLYRADLSSPYHSVDLVILTPRDLGFSSTASFDRICNAARTYGFELCPVAIGPQLALGGISCLEDAWWSMYIASEPFPDFKEEYLEILEISRINYSISLHPRWVCAGPKMGYKQHSMFDPGDHFVFCRVSKTK